MISSTSNFNLSRLRILFCSFSLLYIAMISFNIFLCSTFEHHAHLVNSESNLNRIKHIKDPTYNLIMLGDSRTEYGCDPSTFEAQLPIKAYNFAFAGAGLDSYICNISSENKLIKGTNTLRIFLLGVSPFSLTEKACQHQEYQKSKKESQNLRWLSVFTDKIKINDITYFLSLYLMSKPIITSTESLRYHPDSGWIECFKEPVPESQKLTISNYKLLYAQTNFQPYIQQDLLDWTRRQRHHGVWVFAFRPPSIPAMEALEDSMSGYSEADFRKHFSSAGGIYLELRDRQNYEAYDGSHLNSLQAQRLSRDLASQIKSILISRGVSFSDSH